MRRGRVFILLALIILAVVVVVFVVTTMNGAGDGGVAAPGEQPRAQTAPTPTQIPMTYVVVSVQNLPRGFRITRDALDIVPWPVESGVQENAFTLPGDLIADGVVTQQEKDEYLNPVLNPNSPVGMVARTTISRWQPVLQSFVVRDLAESEGDVGSQTAAILPSGYVAISMPIDILTGVAYAIADGDRVDLIFAFPFIDVDEEFQSRLPNRQSLVSQGLEGAMEILAGLAGRIEPATLAGFPAIVEPVEPQRPRVVTQRTIQNALVVHIGEYPLGGDFLMLGEATQPTPVPGAAAPPANPNATPAPTPKPPRPGVITLGMSPQDAVVLAWAIETQIPITLALRSAADRLAGEEITQPVSLEYIVANYEVARPARLDYALEPRVSAVRSINAILVREGLLEYMGTDGR